MTRADLNFIFNLSLALSILEQKAIMKIEKSLRFQKKEEKFLFYKKANTLKVHES